MDLLARREHSELELSRKLASRGFDPDIIETTIGALVAERLLSNSRFVDSFIHSRLQRGSGPQKIQAELRARGLDDALISDSMAGFDAEWPVLARQVREKRFGSSLPADFKERSRQMRFLQQRGFTSEQISGLFRESE